MSYSGNAPSETPSAAWFCSGENGHHGVRPMEMGSLQCRRYAAFPAFSAQRSVQSLAGQAAGRYSIQS